MGPTDEEESHSFLVDLIKWLVHTVAKNTFVLPLISDPFWFKIQISWSVFFSAWYQKEYFVQKKVKAVPAHPMKL